MLCPSPRGSSGLVQALCSPDPDRGAKGTLSNAPTFPATTRRTSKLLISETSGGEERSRNVLKSQQSLLRPGLVIEGTLAPTAVCWPACSPAGPPSVWDERVWLWCSVWAELTCLPAALGVWCGAATLKDSCLFPQCHRKPVSIGSGGGSMGWRRGMMDVLLKYMNIYTKHRGKNELLQGIGVRSSSKCVPICTLAWKWGCYFQWFFTQCQLRYLCTLLHSEHRPVLTL